MKDFCRISLNPGETKRVKFTIAPSKLAFWNINMEYVVEPGDFEVMVGKSSSDFISKTLLVE